MATIRIISNPYRREIEFAVLKNATNEWTEVNYQNNSRSELITEDVRKNFFPYKIKKIIRILKDEYLSNGETLSLYFKGTEDEYKELEEVCKGSDEIELFRDTLGLENARDILPKIVDIFSEIHPIVDANISSPEVCLDIERNIAKFTDASNDVVPICVLGNYSSGKSTFINALIGLEILPSGDMPVTAKIYRIHQAEDEKKAHVSLEFNEKKVDIDINGDGTHIDEEECSELTDNIKRTFERHRDSSLAERVSACLDVINNQRKGVSDLIDITVPFGIGALKGSNNSFVIFDTPGSNTATYRDHFAILEGAMKDLSNGIPIYVAEYNSLDSCDNESLYEKIKSISQIDSRFTMIVVNKADSANIKEDSFDDDMQEMILSQAVPRNLYSGGIYFVSSIMGLGSKNEGDFFDDHAEEFFEDNERKYSDETLKRYKSLYKYNIMPEQIKQSVIAAAESTDNKIYANSGLLAVEQEIVNFAEKYSAYDKCKQADKYVGRIVDATQKEIDSIKEHREQQKEELQEGLEADKKALIESMEQKSGSLSESYHSVYDENLSKSYEEHKFNYEVDDMRTLEKTLLLAKQEEHNYSDKINDIRESGAEILNNFSEIGKKGLAETVKDFKSHFKETWENAVELKEIKIESDKATADALIEVVSNDYNKRLGSAVKQIDLASRTYWEVNAESVKQALSLIVANSTTLDTEKKSELEKIIISYGDIIFDDEHEFEKAAFEIKLWLPGRVIVLNKINTKKLTDEYNKLYSVTLDSVYEKIKTGHGRSFETWLEQLVNKIRINIVDYSPKLSEQAQKIDDETRAIRELIKTKDRLKNYSREIAALMEWKPVV